MKKVIGLVLAIGSGVSVALAGVIGVGVPEISAAAIPAAIALLGGGILVVRAYLKK